MAAIAFTGFRGDGLSGFCRDIYSPIETALRHDAGHLHPGFSPQPAYAIYSAYQEGYLANIWSIATNAIALLALVIVSRFHGGLPQLVLAMAGTRTLVTMANNYFLFAITGWCHILRQFDGVVFSGFSSSAASTWLRSWLRWTSTKASHDHHPDAWPCECRDLCRFLQDHYLPID